MSTTSGEGGSAAGRAAGFSSTVPQQKTASQVLPLESRVGSCSTASLLLLLLLLLSPSPAAGGRETVQPCGSALPGGRASVHCRPLTCADERGPN